jgi:hypothetical protein
LKVASTGFNVPYSYMYRKYTKHIHIPLPSLFTLPHLLVPQVPSPYHNLFYLPVLHCLSVCSLFSEDSALVFYL